MCIYACLINYAYILYITFVLVQVVSILFVLSHN